MNEKYELPGPTIDIDDAATFVLNIGGMTYMVRLESARKHFQNGLFFSWYGEENSPLPKQQSESISHLLCLAHGLHFDGIENGTKQILYHGVRLYYGLTDADFPLPDILRPKETPRTETAKTRRNSYSNDPLRQPSDHQRRSPLAGVLTIIVCALAAGFLIGREFPYSKPHLPVPVPVGLEHSHNSAEMIPPMPRTKTEQPFGVKQKNKGIPIGIKSP